jgi:small subunit ribosomal protein S20
MANHPSAAKRARQSTKRQARNLVRKSHVRSAVKKFEEALAKKDTKGAKDLLREAEGALARTAQKGTIKRKAASRKISRLAARLKKAA